MVKRGVLTSITASITAGCSAAPAILPPDSLLGGHEPASRSRPLLRRCIRLRDTVLWARPRVEHQLAATHGAAGVGLNVALIPINCLLGAHEPAAVL